MFLARISLDLKKLIRDRVMRSTCHAIVVVDLLAWDEITWLESHWLVIRWKALVIR